MIKIASALFLVYLLTSWIVFVEPAPADLVFIAGFAAVAGAGKFYRMTRHSLFHFSVAGFVLLNVLSVTFAANTAYAVRYAMITAYMVATLYGVWWYIRRAGAAGSDLIVNGFIAAATMAGALGVAAYVGVAPGPEAMYFEYGERLKVFFKDPNVLGPFLVAGAVLAASQVLDGRRFSWLFAAAAAVCALACILTFSRAAIGGLALALAALVSARFVLARTKREAARAAGFVVAGLAVAVPAVIYALFSLDVAGFLAERAQLQNYDSQRFGNHRALLEAASQMPFGIGPGHTSGVSYFDQSEFAISAHNSYLRVLVENGWAGLACFALMMATSFAASVRAALTPSPHQTRVLAVGAILLTIFISSAVIDTIHWRHFFLLWGVAMALADLSRDYAADRAHAVDLGRYASTREIRVV